MKSNTQAQCRNLQPALSPCLCDFSSHPLPCVRSRGCAHGIAHYRFRPPFSKPCFWVASHEPLLLHSSLLPPVSQPPRPCLCMLVSARARMQTHACEPPHCYATTLAAPLSPCSHVPLAHVSWGGLLSCTPPLCLSVSVRLCVCLCAQVSVGECWPAARDEGKKRRKEAGHRPRLAGRGRCSGDAVRLRQSWATTEERGRRGEGAGEVGRGAGRGGERGRCTSFAFPPSPRLVSSNSSLPFWWIASRLVDMRACVSVVCVCVTRLPFSSPLLPPPDLPPPFSAALLVGYPPSPSSPSLLLRVFCFSYWTPPNLHVTPTSCCADTARVCVCVRVCVFAGVIERVHVRLPPALPAPPPDLGLLTPGWGFSGSSASFSLEWRSAAVLARAPRRSPSS